MSEHRIKYPHRARKLLVAALPFLFIAAQITQPPRADAATPPWMDTSLSASQRADLLLAAMTQAERLAMINGTSWGSGDTGYVGNIPANTRLGIPALALEDAGAGVADGMTKVTAFPAPITVASSWDVNLMQRFGSAMAEEQKGKGVNVQLAPMMNMLRVPHAGRNFEGNGEDPYLTSMMAAATIRGIQSQGIIANAKHYLGNETETDRFVINSVIDDRTINEIYLPPFKASVQAGVGSIMCSYNKINGPYACASGLMQNNLLKGELGFRGFIISDWGATHGTSDAVNGLDMEMPGATDGPFSPAKIQNAINVGDMPQSRLDNMVKRILTSMFQVGLFDHAPVGALGTDVRSAAHTQLARDAAAQSIVLLKNDGNTLPLSTANSIAVIGAVGSTSPISQGGGSSWVTPPYTITPFQGIANRASAVRYVDDVLGEVIPASVLTTPGGAAGLQGQYFNNITLSGTPVLTRTDPTINFQWGGGTPGPGVSVANWSARWTGTLRPTTTGTYTLKLTSDDGSRLFINGQQVINNWSDHASQTVSASYAMNAGQAYTVQVEYYNTGGGSNANFTWLAPGVASALDLAVNAASQAYAAVVVVGAWSAEGSDRGNLSLSGTANALIDRIRQVNPRTIVVIYAPAQVLMPWAGQVPTILFGGLPGQEQGNALADVLFGNVNPSGKLPMTIAQNESDYPANTAAQFPGVNAVATYSEGLRVGYRHFDQQNITPLFPFGHGLSYTTFGYGNLSVSPATTSPTGNVTVAFDVTNTGSRAGAEVPQLYLGFPSSAREMPKQLKGFQKVTLNAGQTQRVSLVLTPDLYSHWRQASSGWAVDAGTYAVMVGSSSRNIRLNGSFAVNTSTGALNLALNKPVTSSSTESTTYPASNAVDASSSTRWASAFSDPQWIQIDLGTTTNISRVVLSWEAAYGKAYQIQVSDNASTWTTIYSTTTSDGALDDLTGLSGRGRYIRLYGTARANNFGYSLWDFRVYGPTGVSFYQDADFSGASSGVFAKGDYAVLPAGLPNDWMSSLRIPAGWAVDTYENGSLAGAVCTFTADTPWVGSACNDKMSSFRIR